MKQNLLLQWIEAVEARSVCLLAEEDPARVRVHATASDAQPFNLAGLRKQFCLGEMDKRAPRFPRILRIVNCRARGPMVSRS